RWYRRPRPPPPTLFPYTTLFRSGRAAGSHTGGDAAMASGDEAFLKFSNVKKTYDQQTLVVKDFSLEEARGEFITLLGPSGSGKRSEEHTSELQSRENLVCRLLLE